ncbi:hypothetical protein M2326_002148 [Flavobacterium sp. 7A]|nr:hypothetical protein [Flavobacterium sp. 7A]
MDFIKNLSSLHLYMISVLCFVGANLMRSKSIELYYCLLLVGVLGFVFGLTKRIKKR